MSFGNPKADALHAELMEHARQRNWPLPEPEHGEEWGAYVHRLDQEQRLVLYDRDVMRDLRNYQRLVAHAEELGVPLMERSADLRSEEHTSELQSQSNLVCRLLL